MSQFLIIVEGLVPTLGFRYTFQTYLRVFLKEENQTIKILFEAITFYSYSMKVGSPS